VFISSVIAFSDPTQLPFKISDLVVSLAFGIGKIVAIEHVQGSKNFFYLIQSIDKNMRTMVPVNSVKGLRHISNSKTLMELLESLQQPAQPRFYQTKKDRILNFKERSDASSVNDLIELIREINSLTDRGSIENKLLSDLQSFLAKEVAYINQTTHDEAYNIVLQKCKALVF
jgi:RNA polymerase-interacting CarD/CdnL/TRCF family regulator